MNPIVNNFRATETGLRGHALQKVQMYPYIDASQTVREIPYTDTVQYKFEAKFGKTLVVSTRDVDTITTISKTLLQVINEEVYGKYRKQILDVIVDLQAAGDDKNANTLNEIIQDMMKV